MVSDSPLRTAWGFSIEMSIFNKQKNRNMKYLKITGDVFMYALSYVSYVFMKLLYLLSPWRTIMPFIVWSADEHEMKYDVLLQVAVLILLASVYIFGWWTLAGVGVLIIALGVYLLINLLRMRRYIKNK